MVNQQLGVVSAVARALAICVLLGGCSGGGGGSQSHRSNHETQTDVALATDEPADQTDPLILLFPTDMLRDLQALQQAINLRHARDVQQCMVEQGFDYVAGTSIGAGASSRDGTLAGPLDRARYELGAIDAPSNENVEHFNALTRGERAEWEEAEFACIVGSEFNVAHPFAQEQRLLEELQQAASERTQADRGFVAAKAAADRCLAQAGLDDASTVGADEQVLIVMSEYRAGQISRDAALARIDEIEDLMAEETNALEECNRPLAVITAELFSAHLAEAAEDNPELPFLVAEIRDMIEGYRDVLDEIHESTGG